MDTDTTMSTDDSPALDPSHERYALSRAYVPIPALMMATARHK